MGKTVVTRKKSAIKESGVMANSILNEEDLNFQKVEVEILKLSAGQNFVGKLVDVTTRPWTDRETGEMMEITQYHFIGKDEKAFVYFGDAGFKNLMYTTNIKKGDLIKIVKLDKKALAGTNRSVNDYELFKATSH